MPTTEREKAAIVEVDRRLLEFRYERACAPEVPQDIIERLIARLDEAWGGEVPVTVRVVSSPAAAIDVAIRLGIDRADIERSDGTLIYDSLGATDAYHPLVTALVSHTLGDWGSEGEVSEAETFCDFVRYISGSIYLEDDSASSRVLIVVKLPSVEKVDSEVRLHCADGPALEYEDGHRRYYWHGTEVPADIVLRDRWTPDEIVSIGNTEHRRVLGERLGGARVVEMLGASVVDSWTDPKTGQPYRLLDCEAIEKRFLEMRSPPLHDGSQPIYIESVDRRCVTARGARKWRATELLPEECDADPELEYGEER